MKNTHAFAALANSVDKSNQELPQKEGCPSDIVAFYYSQKFGPAHG